MSFTRTRQPFRSYSNSLGCFQSLPKYNATYGKSIQLMKCRSSHVDNSTHDVPVRLHDKVGLINIGNTCYLNAIMQALYACTK